MDPTLLSNLVAAVLFAVLGIVTFVVAFVIIDRLTPFTLWKEIIEEHNTALAVLIGFIALGISIMNVGVIGMKGFGGGPGIAAKAGLSAAEAYRYALSQPVASQVVGIASMEHLMQNVALARDFSPMTPAEQAALVARVRDVATDGRFELFKSSQMFDGPVHRRQHGFAT